MSVSLAEISSKIVAGEAWIRNRSPRPLRIAIDAREIEKEATGVGRYLTEILKSWGHCVFRENQIFLYFKSRVPDLSFLDGVTFRTKVIGPTALRSDLLWEQALLPWHLKKDRVDVFWGAGGACSGLRLGWKNVVSVYDLTFFMDKTWFSPREAAVRRWKTAVSAATADRLVTLSDATVGDLKRFFGVPSSRVRRIYAGADHVPSKEGRNSQAAGKSRVLFVGSILNRRPIANLVRAVALLKDRFPALTLTVIGDNRTRPRQDLAALAADLGLDGRVAFEGYVDEAALRRAYAEADFFCFPSLYEGFGIPVVEAQRHGLPVLTLKNSSLAEIAGDSVHYAAGHRPEDFAEGLEKLLTERAYCEILVERGFLNSRKFRWSESGRAVWDLLGEGF